MPNAWFSGTREAVAASLRLEHGIDLKADHVIDDLRGSGSPERNTQSAFGAGR